jgi:hypothetical protein
VSYDPDTASPALIQEIERIYRDAAKRLRQQIIAPAGGGSDSAREWNQSRAAQIYAQVKQEIDQLKGRATRWTSNALQESFDKGLATADRQLRAAGVSGVAQSPSAVSSISGSFAGLDRATVQILAQDAAGDFVKAANSMQLNAFQALQGMAATGVTNAQVSRILAGAVIEGQPEAAVLQLKIALQKIHGDKVTIQNKAGNPMTFDVDYYARLVATSKTSEAQIRARHQRIAEKGIYTVRIIGPSAIDICGPFVGHIYSLPGYTGSKYPPLSSLPRGGPKFHPNCSHSTSPYGEGLSYPAQEESAASAAA